MINPKLEAEQNKRLKKFRAGRDGKKLESILLNLKATAETDAVNMMPIIIEAVDNGATLGEISNTLRSVFGEYGS